MYGRVAIYLGQGKWDCFTREEMLKKRPYDLSPVRRALDYYEIPVRDFIAERHWRNGNKREGLTARECMITQLPARSWVRYVIDFRQTFGTRFFLACHGQQTNWLFDAYDLVKGKHENKNLRDDPLRGLSPLAGCSGGSVVSPAHTPAPLPRARREGGDAR
jgi:hypothetical protein